MVLSIIENNPENLLTVEKQLTIKPNIKFGKINNPDTYFPLYKITKKNIIIPYYSLNCDKDPIIETNNITYIKSTDNNIILRPGHQENCFNEIINSNKKNGIINLTTSCGKTVLSLKLIQHLKIKTLILVNKSELLQQWIDRIKQFLPNHTYGIIQGKTFDRDCDITIGMVQTLSINNNITINDLKIFNMTIIDEVHSIATKVFSNVFFKITSYYQFGLSATIERSDKLDIVFKYFLGDIIYSNVHENNSLKQESIVLKYTKNFNISNVKYINFMGERKINLSNLLNQLSECNIRNDFIVNIIKNIIETDSCKKIICMSDRIGCLKYIYSKLTNTISSLYIGSMNKEQLNNARKSKVILATYSMVIQGFDQPDINTLLFITPRSNIEQAIGRIYRKEHDITPCIIDIVDIIDSEDPTPTNIFRSQYKKREKVYKAKINNVYIKHFN